MKKSLYSTSTQPAVITGVGRGLGSAVCLRSGATPAVVPCVRCGAVPSAVQVRPVPKFCNVSRTRGAKGRTSTSGSSREEVSSEYLDGPIGFREA